MQRVGLVLLVLAVTAANLACSNGAGPPSDETSQDELRRGGLKRRDLPRGAFRTRAEAVAQEWLDGNIMSGEALLDAGTLEGTLTKDALSKFAVKMTTDHLKRNERPFEGMASQTPRFDDALVKEAARVVALDGFQYADRRQNIDPVEANVRELIGFLGNESKLDVVKVTGKATDDGPWRVTQFLFINRETKVYVAFYACEGPA